MVLSDHLFSDKIFLIQDEERGSLQHRGGLCLLPRAEGYLLQFKDISSGKKQKKSVPMSDRRLQGRTGELKCLYTQIASLGRALPLVQG